jgi:ubiquinone/menaquinone biosynthesis C-methylase UbiE
VADVAGNAWAKRAREEAIAQWEHDPAGSNDAGTAQLVSPEAFVRIEAARYRQQPWMHETFRFERFRGARVLELGVGLGTDHIQFARAGAKMAGIDLVERCVKLTRERLAQEGLASELAVGDAEQLAFPDDSFDAVFSFGVLHHTSSAERAFGEVRRVLRPGGCFLGGLYSRESFVFARLVLGWVLPLEFLREPLDNRLSRMEYSTSDAMPYVRLFRREDLREALREAGFDRVAIRRRHFGLFRVTPHTPRALEDILGRVGGWYLVHEAR